MADVTVIMEFPEINYTLLYKPDTFQPWIAAWGYDKGNGTWAQGHYFSEKLEVLAYIVSKYEEAQFNENVA